MNVPARRGTPYAPKVFPYAKWGSRGFLVFGLLLLGYCGYELLTAKLFQSGEDRRFQDEVQIVKQSASTASVVREASLRLGTAGVLGEIKIARLGIAAVIMEGTADRTLLRAVGHISGTAEPGQPGNVGIAGHRDTFFRALKDVRENDAIDVTTLDGVDHYRVDSIQLVPPEDTEVLDASGSDTLTLVTCYPFYFVGPAPRRFIVRAQRIISEN